MKKSKPDMKHKEAAETPGMEAKYHSKGFLKKALGKKAGKVPPKK